MEYEQSVQEALAWVPESGAFCQWIVQDAHRAGQALAALRILDQEASTVLDLVAVRDAAHTLVLLAYEGGFGQVAWFYAGVYDKYCLMLLYYA